MSRHFKHHVSRQRRAELVAGPAKVQDLVNAAADESKGLLEYFQVARSVLFNQFLAAAEAGDRLGVANIAGRLLDALDRLGKLTGELRQASGLTINHNTINLLASPEFMALQRGLLDLARAHPGARADIVALLRSLDSKAVGGSLPADALSIVGDTETGAAGLPLLGAAPAIEGRAVNVV